jgi:cytochrome P450
LKMDIIGSEHGHPLDDALQESFAQILIRSQMPVWMWKLQRYFTIGSERRYRYITGEIRRMVSEMVSKSLDQSATQVGQRADPTSIIELIIRAIQAGDADGITPELLRDMSIMFILGGRDTTSDTLSWTLLMVSKHPEVERKLRDELWRKVPELMEGKVKTLSMEQIQTLTYLEATLKEALRYYPPAPITQREAARDTHLVDGTFVPKGCRVEFATYVMGRLPSVWGDDVHEFKPERFIDEATDRPITHSSFKLFSFSAGPRICVGMNLAFLELKLVLATMLSRYQLEMAPNDGTYRFTANLSVKNPLIARVRPAAARQ